MPLFDFVCRACGKEFEALVLGGDRPRCPQCHSEDLCKQMSTFAMRTSGAEGGGGGAAAGGGSKCSGCAGGSCSSCH